MFEIEDKRLALVNSFSKIMSSGEAIRKSIKKWEFVYDNIDSINQEGGGSTCALCFLYAVRGCIGCPVREDTGSANCQGTPWWGAHEIVGDRYATEESKQIAVQLEIDYLKGILLSYLEEHNEI